MSHVTLVPLLSRTCDYQYQHEFTIVSGDKQTSIDKVLFNSLNCFFPNKQKVIIKKKHFKSRKGKENEIRRKISKG